MDFFFLTLVYNATDVPSPFIQTIITTVSITCESLSHFLLILLIVYRNLKKKQAENYHSPIFNQFFYLSIGIVIFRDFCRLLSLSYPGSLDDVTHHGFISFVVFLLYFGTINIFIQLNDTFVQIVLVFSFLAATQRIVIVYFSSYKFLVTGRFLKGLIVMCWLILLHYFWLSYGSCWFNSFLEDEEFSCFLIKWTLPIAIYRVLFGCSILATVLIFRHFYKLISQLPDQNINIKSHLLYQFVPVYTFLTIYTCLRYILNFIGWSQGELEVSEFVMLMIGTVVSSFIPIVVCFSYIASQDNMRAWITEIIYPIWERLDIIKLEEILNSIKNNETERINLVNRLHLVRVEPFSGTMEELEQEIEDVQMGSGGRNFADERDRINRKIARNNQEKEQLTREKRELESKTLSLKAESLHRDV